MFLGFTVECGGIVRRRLTPKGRVINRMTAKDLE